MRTAKKSRMVLAFFLLGAACASYGQTSAKPVSGYDYRFGKSSPYLPSQAQSESDSFIEPGAFPTAQYCGRCHRDTQEQWRQSAHSNSFREPFYTKNVNLLIDTKGIEFTRHCEGCHNPIALFSGALTKGSPIDRRFDQDGITCTTCHSIQKIQNTSGTGSYVMGIPAVMVDENGKRIPGQVPFYQIFDHPERHVKAVMQDFYRTPEFCAACHKAAVPKLLNDYKWQRAFSVYDEWQQSSWSKQNPLPFYKKEKVQTCQDCHMPSVDAKKDYGSVAGHISSHRWLAANTAIPKYFGFDAQLEQTVKFLENDLLSIDAFALENQKGDQVAPLDPTKASLSPGEKATLSLVIQNKGIGHSLVPEQRDFYESWVEFRVTDADGNVLANSGYLQPDGMLDPAAHSYTNRLIGKDGTLLDRHQVWMTKIKAYDNTILPGRSDVVRYEFEVPSSTKGPLTITAKVNYRRFRQGFLDYVLGEKKDYPIAQLAVRTFTLGLEKPQQQQFTPPAPDWMRWNNYGIALLDQQQYAQAISAFERVAALRPDYADAQTNIALTNYMYEKYEPAMQAIERALKIAPGDPRATFYKASILRVQGKLDEAAQLFEQVATQFPRLRDAHRELAYIYYEKQDYERSRREYEALQQVDPDDLAGHYGLMRVYRKLGMKEKAEQQAALFYDRKDDPTVGPLGLGFLAKHADLSAESVPWHKHTLVPELANAPAQKSTMPSGGR